MKHSTKDMKAVDALFTNKIIPLQSAAQLAVDKLKELQKELNHALSTEAAESTAGARWALFVILGDLRWRWVLPFCSWCAAPAGFCTALRSRWPMAPNRWPARRPKSPPPASRWRRASSEQAASLEETSSSSEEINSMARKNAENSQEWPRNSPAQVDQTCSEPRTRHSTRW